MVLIMGGLHSGDLYTLYHLWWQVKLLIFKIVFHRAASKPCYFPHSLICVKLSILAGIKSYNHQVSILGICTEKPFCSHAATQGDLVLCSLLSPAKNIKI